MKKFVIILGVIFAFNAASAMAAYEIGDVDCNGKITATDSAYLAKRANDESFKLPIESEGAESYYYDFDSDGEITLEDARALLETVRNKDLKTIYSEKQLKIDEIGWAYPNAIYWTLADYPSDKDQNYVVEIYKNGEKLKEINIALSSEEAYDIRAVYNEYVYDLTSEIENDKTAEYTFRVKALGGDSGLYDSSFTSMSNKYIYNEEDSEENTFISVSDSGTVQIKVLNYDYYIENWFKLDNDDILKQISVEKNFLYGTGSDTDGGKECEITTFVPIKAGSTAISFYYSTYGNETGYLKTVNLTVDENLNVTTE